MTINELLNKPLTTNTTFDSVLRYHLGDRYESEIEKINGMNIAQFYDYFDKLLGEED